MIAVVAVFGVAWMADTVFEANLPVIKASLAEVVKAHPWTYALALLVVSKLVNSQAAAISAMVPVALAIGVPPGYVVAFAAACYGYYILPTYPSDLATIQFDRSGTTQHRQVRDQPQLHPAGPDRCVEFLRRGVPHCRGARHGLTERVRPAAVAPRTVGPLPPATLAAGFRVAALSSTTDIEQVVRVLRGPVRVASESSSG